jgi:hypothetical protein
MGNLKALMAIAASAFTLTGAQPAAAGFYSEVGDAGGLTSSQSLGPAGMEFNGITGNVGGDTDPADAFGFFFGGGDLFAQITQLSGLSVSVIPAAPPDPIFPADPMVPDGPPTTPIYAELAINGVMGWNLAAGDYIIEFAKAGPDPAYIATFYTANPFGATNPPPSAFVSAPQPAPEPATAALVALALAGLAAVRRRRARSAGQHLH